MIAWWWMIAACIAGFVVGMVWDEIFSRQHDWTGFDAAMAETDRRLGEMQRLRERTERELNGSEIMYMLEVILCAIRTAKDRDGGSS